MSIPLLIFLHTPAIIREATSYIVTSLPRCTCIVKAEFKVLVLGRLPATTGAPLRLVYLLVQFFLRRRPRRYAMPIGSMLRLSSADGGSSGVASTSTSNEPR